MRFQSTLVYYSNVDCPLSILFVRFCAILQTRTAGPYRFFQSSS
ncbi:MAG: hypothetical protein NZ953_04615 [Thaumarchaeota archaeon]|nr:hypothetical protein [Candidatus Calditenuaceae archaeon]